MNILPYPKIGDCVKVVQKKDYASGELTEGIVKDLLTKQHGHPRGTKVRLTSGIIGRIQEFMTQKEAPIDKKEEKNETIYVDDSEALI